MKCLWFCRVVAAVICASACFVSANADPVRGAGSTFAAPVLDKWSKNYLAVRTDGGDFQSPDWHVDFEPVGSLAGIMRLQQQEIDFAATEQPLPPEEVMRHGYAQFPLVFGAVAIVVNVDATLPKSVQLTGPVLADIFAGKIVNWSAPEIASINPDLKLPDLPIVVARRSDGSGSTFALTSYLSSVSDTWKQQYGADTVIDWPVGEPAKGTRGILDVVARTPGAIGYVEAGQAQRAKLAHVLLRNRAGQFVAPDAAAVNAAIAAINWAETPQFYASLINLEGQDVYPLAAATYAVVALRDREGERLNRTRDFFTLGLTKGAADAAALGFVAVPQSLLPKIQKALTSKQKIRASDNTLAPSNASSRQ